VPDHDALLWDYRDGIGPPPGGSPEPRPHAA